MKSWTLIVLALLWTAPAWAATYYVRTDGNDANTGTTNTDGGAWRTIDYAADHAVAGDTVRVQAGTYVETVGPAHNGSSGNTITLVADGTVTLCSMSFNANNQVPPAKRVV